MTFRTLIEEAVEKALPPSVLTRWKEDAIPYHGAQMRVGGRRRLQCDQVVCYLHRVSHGSLRLTTDATAGEWKARPTGSVERFHALWKELEIGAETPSKRLALAHSMLSKLPCGECKTHWRQALADHPPMIETEEAWRRWVWERHDEVSARLGKERISFEDALAGWATA